MKGKSLTAFLIMILAIMIAVPWGVNSSLEDLYFDYSSDFYYDKTGFSIYEGIEARTDICNNLLKVAEKYLDDHPELNSSYSALESAVSYANFTYDLHEDQYLSDKGLDDPAKRLYEELDALADVSETEKTALSRSMMEMQSYTEKITHSSYNEKAEAYNNKIHSFPLRLFSFLNNHQDLPVYLS